MIGALLVGIAGSAIRFATPYLYAAVGETLGQLSGVLNLGVEGIMLMAAFSAFWATMQTGSLALGLLAAIATGALFGLLIAFINITLKAEQGISGIGLYLLGLGLSAFLFRIAIGGVQAVAGFPEVPVPLLSAIPVVGKIFFRQNVLVYGAFALVPLMWFVVHRTPFGLKVRAAGQNPQAADSLGVDVVRIRYLSAVAGGVLAGLAGASLSIALLNIFQENLTNGMGFIAVALVFFRRLAGRGGPGRRPAVQHRERHSTVDPDPGGGHPLGFRPHDALRGHDPGARPAGQAQGERTGGLGQAFRARQGVNGRR